MLRPITVNIHLCTLYSSGTKYCLSSLCSANHSQASTQFPNPYHTATARNRVTSQCLCRTDFALCRVKRDEWLATIQFRPSVTQSATESVTYPFVSTTTLNRHMQAETTSNTNHLKYKLHKYIPPKPMRCFHGCYELAMLPSFLGCTPIHYGGGSKEDMLRRRKRWEDT